MMLQSMIRVCSTSYPSSIYPHCHVSPSSPIRSRRVVMRSSQSPSFAKASTKLNEDIFRVIQSHQEKAARLSPIEEVRTLLDCSLRGMLSTFSQKYEGYPSSSMVDFACDAHGSPILAISSLAAHSKDLKENPKCALLVTRDPEDRTDLIVTLYGDALQVTDDQISIVREAYLAKHPNALWVDFGDFYFVRIEPNKIRYVSGVASAMLGQGDFTKNELMDAKVDPVAKFGKPVALHMNKDHEEDTKLIVQHATSIPVESAHMLNMDSLGFDARVVINKNSHKLRIPFRRRANDRKDIKTLVVEMLQEAKANNNL